MTSAAASAIETVAEIFVPLLDALESMPAMEALLSDLGIEVALTEMHATVFNDIMPLAVSLGSLVETAEANADATGQEDVPDGLEDALQVASVLFETLSALGAASADLRDQLPGELGQSATWERIGRELPGYLLIEWLDTFYPAAGAFLELGGAIDKVPRGAGQPPRRVFDWAAAAALVRDPPGQIAATWNWGGSDFDSSGMLIVLGRLLWGLGLRPRITVATRTTRAALGDRSPSSPVGLTARILPRPPKAGETSNDPALPFPMDGLAELVLTGVSRPGQTGTSGLALLPRLAGNFVLDHEIARDIDLRLSGQGEFAGGVALALYPDGPEILTGPDASAAAASVTLSFGGDRSAEGGGWYIVGGEDTTHLRINRFAAAVTVDTAPTDIRVLVDLEDAIALRVQAGPETDGLLASVLGDVEVEVFGGLSALWSARDGWVFSGGVGLEVQIPIDRSLGPIHVQSLTLLGAASVDAQQGAFQLGAAVTGSFSIGPIALAFEEIGVVSDLSPMAEGTTGNLGPVQIDPRFKPPEGYGAGVAAGPVTGGGFLARTETGYRGAFALEVEDLFGLSAYGILDTVLPGGEDGFSFAAMLFIEFSVPLAAGFSLTGCGGMIGINRTIDTDAMRDVLYAGRLDDMFFPDDPIGDAVQILDDMAFIMPARTGQHFIGPVVRISWGTPPLVHLIAGVIIEVGSEVRIVLVGAVKMALPVEDAALVVFSLSFFGEIDFAEGRVDFDATLTGSRLLIFTITGDAAVRSGWGPGIEQIASLGGLHPLYPKPDNLPNLARLGAGFGNPGSPVRLTLGSYFAQTLNSVQFGTRADLFVQGPKFPVLGRVTAEGFIRFDALIYFNPFSFLTELEGGLSLMVNGKVKAALYFSLTLSGPNPFHIAGEVWVRVCRINVRFAATHTFGAPQSAPNVTASAVDALRAALEAPTALEAGQGGSSPVTFRAIEGDEALFDPSGRLTLRQVAVPLGVRLQTLGEAEIVGATRLSIAVSSSAGPVTDLADVEDDFVRGHFFGLTQAERLRQPSYETHTSGVAFATEGIAATGLSVQETYGYEIIRIGVDEEEDDKRLQLDPFLKGTFGRFVRTFEGGRVRPAEGLAHATPAIDAVGTRATGFALEGKVADATVATAGTVLSKIGRGKVAAQRSVNAVVPGYFGAL